MRIIIAAIALSAVLPAVAQESVASFYRGRTLSVIIPSSVGGGYDLYGRLVARHIGRHIPGNPATVAQNMAGAAGVVAAQHVYAAAAKDGGVLGLTYPNALMEELVGRARPAYDARKFNYIGSANAEVFICYVATASPVKAFADVFEREVVLGASGGVGVGCVQIARDLGATVIACASSADKLERLKKLGAHHLIDYSKENFSKVAWEISGKKGVDVCINFTGGDTWVPSIRSVRP